MLSCSLPTHRETLEVIALLESGQVFEARFIKGDTGLFKGQGHLRINKWLHRNSNMAFYIDTPPVVSDITPTSADLWGHRLYKTSEADAPFWQLHVRSEEYNVSAQIQTPTQEIQTLEGEDWTVNILSPHAQMIGWMSAAGRSAMLKGEVALFHRSGEGLLQSDRHLLLAFDSHNHFGLEDSNLISQSWGTIDGQSYHSQNIQLNLENNQLKIQILDNEITFFPEKTMGEEAIFDHLTAVEYQASSLLFNVENRNVFQGYIKLSSGRQLPAVYIHHGEAPFSTPKD